MRSFVVLTAMPFVGKECCQRSVWWKDWRWINGNASNEAVAPSTVSKCLLPARIKIVRRLDQETLYHRTCCFHCTLPTISTASWTGIHKSSKSCLLWCHLLNRQFLFLLDSPRWRTISTSYLWRTNRSSTTTIEFDKSTSRNLQAVSQENTSDRTTTKKPGLSSKAQLKINSVKCFVNELWLILKREMHIKPC